MNRLMKYFFQFIISYWKWFCLFFALAAIVTALFWYANSWPNKSLKGSKQIFERRSVIFAWNHHHHILQWPDIWSIEAAFATLLYFIIC